MAQVKTNTNAIVNSNELTQEINRVAPKAKFYCHNVEVRLYNGDYIYFRVTSGSQNAINSTTKLHSLLKKQSGYNWSATGYTKKTTDGTFYVIVAINGQTSTSTQIWAEGIGLSEGALVKNTSISLKFSDMMSVSDHIIDVTTFENL